MNQSRFRFRSFRARVGIPYTALVVVDCSSVGVRDGVFTSQSVDSLCRSGIPSSGFADVVLVGAVAKVREAGAACVCRKHQNLETRAKAREVHTYVRRSDKFASLVCNFVSFRVCSALDHRFERSVEVGWVNLPERDTIRVLTAQEDTSVGSDTHFSRIVGSYSVRECSLESLTALERIFAFRILDRVHSRVESIQTVVFARRVVAGRFRRHSLGNKDSSEVRAVGVVVYVHA